MKSLLKYMAFALVMGLLFCGLDAMADDKAVFQNTFNVLARTFKNVRVIVYVIGAFGLIGIALGGIVGKINFKWLGYLAAGLAIIAVADWVVTYAIGARNNTNANADITFDENSLAQ